MEEGEKKKEEKAGGEPDPLTGKGMKLFLPLRSTAAGIYKAERVGEKEENDHLVRLLCQTCIMNGTVRCS